MEHIKTFIETKGKYQYLQVFGLHRKQSDKLFEFFKEVYLEKLNTQYTERQIIYNEYGMTARKKIISDEKLSWYLHIVLYYLRNYPTFEVLGWQIGKFKQEAQSIISKWFIVVMKSLSKCRVVPARDLNNLEEIANYLLGIGVLKKEDLDIIIDVTERRINRPQSSGIQRLHYSGKKSVIQ